MPKLDEQIKTLAGYFAADCEPDGKLTLQLEVEHFLTRSDGQPPAFADVQAALRDLQQQTDAPIITDGEYFGYSGPALTATLGPACQLRISLAPLRDVQDIMDLYNRFYLQLGLALAAHGLRAWTAGCHPTCHAEDLPLVPRTRDEAMDAYLREKGACSVQMMRATAATQVSIDYQDETDFVLGLMVIKKDEPMTVKVTRTILLLPEEAMRPRLADSRIGIFLTDMSRINGKKDKIEDFSVINRWNIQPKDLEAWKRGELVEPVKPIVFYLDDAFPALWREPIRRGVLRWNKAFEKIGFKNVMHIEDFPKDDPEFDPDNLKYSCIRYVPAAVANAMGPSWVDPRSGEIINASVLMYNDVVKLAANWRFVQTAQVDERVRGKELPDDVFQESLEYILAHEVGHCLGLMHNMAASSAFPVDSLRSASFTQQHGTTPSIMDYARFNYVAQPGDKGVKLTPPDLGPYDDYVIKYAYTPLPDKKDMFDEEKTIRGWIDEKVGDPIYRYGRQQVIARYDPTAIEEDLGDDHIKAGDYGIGNLKYVLSHMEEWITDEEDPDLKIRTELYEAAAGQFARYVNAVMLNVGGIYLTDVNSNTAGGPQAVSVPKELQRASLKWVLAQMKDSAWLEQPALTEKLPLHVDLSFILRFNFCRAFFTYYKNVTLSSHIADDPYTPQEYMDDLYNIVFESTIKGRPVSPSERLIQRMFVDAAADVASSEAKRMKLGGIAEAYAPSVDEIALLGLDRSGIVERYLGPLREAEEEHGKGYVASQLWNSDALSSGYGWQYNVQLRSIDESRALFVNVNDRILKLLRSRVKSTTGETRAHYQGMIYVLERSLFPSQKN